MDLFKTFNCASFLHTALVNLYNNPLDLILVDLVDGEMKAQKGGGLSKKA